MASLAMAAVKPIIARRPFNNSAGLHSSTCQVAIAKSTIKIDILTGCEGRFSMHEHKSRHNMQHVVTSIAVHVKVFAHLIVVHRSANVAKALQLDLGFGVLCQEHVQAT